MAQAEVGDDVLGDDPTASRLQQRIAQLLGKQAALFTPSGSMANQIAIKLHCLPGDQFYCEANCHISLYEQGGFAQLSGTVARMIPGRCGVMQLDQLPMAIAPDDDHSCRTKLLTLENTHNRGGGTIQPQQTITELCDWAKRNNLATHLDGARLFNASVATGLSLQELAQPFDTVNVCFSKGLGAPVGSALVGSAEMIRRARRVRKVLGGGMRQVGILAAAALYALENNFQRLAQDHAHAQELAWAIDRVSGFELDPLPQTNIVIFKVDPAKSSANSIVARLAEQGIGAIAFGPQHVRLVTHLDINAQQVDFACQAISRL